MGKIGVLTEQGFVEGSGLGFNPINENELHKDNTKKEEEINKDKDNNE